MVAASLDKSHGFFWLDARLLVFFACVDLYKELKHLALFLHLICNGLGDFLAINRLDGVKERDGVRSFVGL